MLTKVQDMLTLANQAPYPDVYILNGKIKSRVSDMLLGRDVLATHITR